MAVATRTLKDTVVNAEGAGGKVTVLITFDDETSSDNNVLDASGLSGHANGAMWAYYKQCYKYNSNIW